MSTLRVTNVQDTAGANSLTTAQIYNGAAKAWVNFNGTFATSPFTIDNGGIRASFNVSSITDNGISDYTVNFTTAMVDANYSTLLTARSSNDALATALANISSQDAPTTLTIRIRTSNPGVAYIDYDHINVAVFR